MTTDMTHAHKSDHVKTHWLIAGLIIAVIGIALSIYSSRHHLEVKATGQTDAACNINEKFSCDDVALSQFSEIGGIPLGVFGLGYFVASGVLLLVGLTGGKSGKEHMQGYVFLVLIGVLTSIALAIISATQLGTYCITCIGVYVLTGLQVATLIIWRNDLPGGFTPKNVFSGGTTAVIAVAGVILVFNFTKSYLAPSGNSGDTTQTPENMPTLAATAQEIQVSKSAYSGLGEDYRKGNDNAKVVINEFADFQCPACARASETLSALHKEYGDRVLIVFRNYPLDSSCNSSVQARIHESACNAAVMARCAGQYGKFWQYHDLAFNFQKEMSQKTIRQWGTQVGLTDEQMDQCLASKDILEKVKADIALGNQLGVDSTPTLFLNGRKVLGGRGISELKNEIDQLLN